MVEALKVFTPARPCPCTQPLMVLVNVIPVKKVIDEAVAPATIFKAHFCPEATISELVVSSKTPVPLAVVLILNVPSVLLTLVEKTSTTALALAVTRRKRFFKIPLTRNI